MRLQGKVALITGAASGMGECEAKLFAREGARVVVADVVDAEAKRVVAEIEKAGGSARFAKLDVSREDDWRAALADTIAAWGRLDILVNNAGVGGGGDPGSLENWDRVMAINAKGAFLGMKHAIASMRERGGGAIVNITSLAATVGVRDIHMGYGASKAAIWNMTRAAAVTNAKHGVRVNSVAPGFMPPMRPPPGSAKPNMDPAVRAKLLEAVPMGRDGRVEEVAAAVLFLASDEASYITGIEIPVDGGALAL
jgi:NAD(P)-dependent dehydrogenase (short-subunit alcohol dehydrogenase family)